MCISSGLRLVEMHKNWLGTVELGFPCNKRLIPQTPASDWLDYLGDQFFACFNLLKNARPCTATERQVESDPEHDRPLLHSLAPKRCERTAEKSSL